MRRTVAAVFLNSTLVFASVDWASRSCGHTHRRKAKALRCLLVHLLIVMLLSMELNSVKTYEDMTLEELEENEDEFNEEDERAIEMYRLVPTAGTAWRFVCY